jgi:hypothetical protein
LPVHSSNHQARDDSVRVSFPKFFHKFHVIAGNSFFNAETFQCTGGLFHHDGVIIPALKSRPFIPLLRKMIRRFVSLLLLLLN